MGKTKDKIFGYTNVEMMVASFKFAKNRSFIQGYVPYLPYYTAKKKKMKFTKFSKKNLKDCKIHFVRSDAQKPITTVLIDPDGNVVKSTRMTVGKKSGLGYTLSLKKLEENITAFLTQIGTPALAYEPIYSFKIVESNELLWIWDSPDYDMFMELTDGKIVKFELMD